MTRRRSLPPPMWRVQMERHTVVRRYLIPAERMWPSAVSETDAREHCVQLVHARLAIPPWRLCRRESFARTTATRIGSPKPAAVYPEAHHQLPLDRFAA